MSGVHHWQHMPLDQTRSPATVLSNLTLAERYYLEEGIKMEQGMIHGSLTLKKGYVVV